MSEEPLKIAALIDPIAGRKGNYLPKERKEGRTGDYPNAPQGRLAAADDILASNWLAEHDRAVAEKTAATIVATVRAHCTPSSDAYATGGDPLIYAVADWIENPPEWVNASWVKP